MSETAPDGPYVYQPYGSVSHPDRARTGRLYGVGGVGREVGGGVTIKGLTKTEAQLVVDVLSRPEPTGEQ